MTVRAAVGATLLAAAVGCDPSVSSSDAAPGSRDASVVPSDARQGSAPPSSDPQVRAREEARARLRAYEDDRVAGTDFATLTPWSDRAGDDPFALRAVPGGAPVGLLRGAGALVRLGPHGEVGERVATTRGATSMALDDAGRLLVVSPRSNRVQTFALPPGAGAPQAQGEVAVAGARGLRSIGVFSDAGTWVVGDPHAHRVHVLDPPRRPGVTPVTPRWSAPCTFPLDVRYVGRNLVALCMLEHAVKVWRCDARGVPVGAARRIEHDGPIWALDASVRDDGTLRLALAGVEDRPLDRSDGAFGHVDSYAFVVDLPAQGDPVRRLEHNVAQHGAVTPKWIELHDEGGRSRIDVIGYGADVRVSIELGETPRVSTTSLLPGITDAMDLGDGRGWLYADPLLDAWVVVSGEERRVYETGQTPPPQIKLGEALAFTVAMAPHASSEGRRSRFTCETCHFEGGVDGRTHWTGRGEVFATTRPLWGLMGNRPHFSRALDPTMATMVDNEFRVASRGTGVDPWFDLGPADLPWLAQLGVDGTQDAEALRRALMAFLMALAPEPPMVPAEGSPAAQSDADGALARRGVEVFAAHCESCHAARRVTDDPTTHVDQERWLDEAATIVWAQEARMQTGVLPYVHSEGARVPPLRRLSAKRPYFTNGSAKSLADVLSRFVVAAEATTTARHDAQPGTLEDGARHLTADERRALRAFLARL